MNPLRASAGLIFFWLPLCLLGACLYFGLLQGLRAAWRTLVAGQIDAKRLVFVEEMGSNTSLFSLYA